MTVILEKPGSSLWLFCGLAMASPAEWATGEGAPRGRVLGCLSGHCPHVRVCARAHVCAFLSLAVCTCASASPALCGRPVPVVLWSPRRSLRRFPGPGAQAPAGPRLAEPSVVGALLRAARRGHHRPGGPGSPASQRGSRPSALNVAVGSVGLGLPSYYLCYAHTFWSVPLFPRFCSLLD